MLSKSKFIIFALVGLLFFSCDTTMPPWSGFTVIVVENSNGSTNPLEGIPYTVRKYEENSILLKRCTADGTFTEKGTASVGFISDPNYHLYMDGALYLENYEDNIKKMHETASYYMVINDSSCEEFNPNYKADVIVECILKGTRDTCDITK